MQFYLKEQPRRAYYHSSQNSMQKSEISDTLTQRILNQLTIQATGKSHKKLKPNPQQNSTSKVEKGYYEAVKELSQ